MESMIERVAKALRTCSEGEGAPWDSDQQKRFWSFYAEAAIEAMRDPTEAMVIAGVHHENMGDMAGRWSSMIDAALNEHEGAKT